jgi:hypothetical protein
VTTRRGFLGAMLAAAVAPAIVRAELLMPVRPVIAAPPIFTGEIGWIDGFRFIETPHLDDRIIDTLRYGMGAATMAYANGPPPTLTMRAIRRASMLLERNRGPLPFIVHPAIAADMRAAGFKVAPPGWRPPDG